MSRVHRIVSLLALMSILAVPGCAMRGGAPESVTHISDGLAKVYSGYGVSEARRAGDFLYLGGIVAFADDGSVIAPNDGEAQIRVIYQYIEQLLTAHGATLKNVVSETHYLTDWDEFVKGAPIRIKAYDDAGAAYPTSVAFEAKSLAAEGLVVEIGVIAYLGD